MENLNWGCHLILYMNHEAKQYFSVISSTNIVLMIWVLFSVPYVILIIYSPHSNPGQSAFSLIMNEMDYCLWKVGSAFMNEVEQSGLANQRVTTCSSKLIKKWIHIFYNLKAFSKLWILYYFIENSNMTENFTIILQVIFNRKRNYDW